MFFQSKFQESVRNFCPKFVRNEVKSVQKLKARNSAKLFASDVYDNALRETFRTFHL